MLEKLRTTLAEIFNPPAPPVTPPPVGTPFTEWKPAHVTAARKLLKEGKPESLASLIESLPAVVRGEVRGYSHSLRREVIVHDLIGGLNAAQMDQAFSQSSPEKKRQLINETLAYTRAVQDRYPATNTLLLGTLLAAEAVDAQDTKSAGRKPSHIPFKIV